MTSNVVFEQMKYHETYLISREGHVHNSRLNRAVTHTHGPKYITLWIDS